MERPDSRVLTGAAIGLGAAMIYSWGKTKIVCDACERKGGTCRYKCWLYIFCGWICEMPKKPGILW
jgi:hypothetical protein